MLLTLAFSAISLFPAYPASTPAPEWPTQRMKFEKIAAKSSSSMIGTPEQVLTDRTLSKKAAPKNPNP